MSPDLLRAGGGGIWAWGQDYRTPDPLSRTCACGEGLGTRLGIDRLVPRSDRTLVSFPDQDFRARPADSSKNRVWALSQQKLGQVYLRRSVNWVIVGVNYIISTQQHLLWRLKICKLAIYDDAFT